MRLAGSDAADEHGVALVGDEDAVGKAPDQHLIDRRAVEVELIDVLGDRQLGDGELVFTKGMICQCEARSNEP